MTICMHVHDTNILHFVDHMQKKYITYGNIPFAIHKSLNFIMFLKTAIHHRFILMLLEKNANRKTLVMFGISNKHIDQAGMTRFHRTCPVCGLNIEDEIHFLFDCPNYLSVTDDFF